MHVDTTKTDPSRARIRACLIAALLAMPVVLHAQVTLAASTVADNPDARPPVTATDLAILQRARLILATPATWNRADNRVCPPAARTFSLYCALEKATIEQGQDFAHRGAALQEVRFVIDEVAATRNYDHRLMDYNNDPATSIDDIHEVLLVAERIVALRLRTESAASSALPSASPPKQQR